MLQEKRGSLSPLSPLKKRKARMEGGGGLGGKAPALLDPAMRKGLRLVYAHLLKHKRKQNGSGYEGGENGGGGGGGGGGQ